MEQARGNPTAEEAGVRIRREALELAFRIVLSCPCDVTAEQERRVFGILQSIQPREPVAYGAVLEVFGPANTPFHRLAAFTRWIAPVEGEPVIEREHVLRLNASSYHWEHAASTPPQALRGVSSLSAWMLAHMVLPVRLLPDADGELQAVYRFGGAHGQADRERDARGEIALRHVFMPPELDPAVAELWAVHFAAVVGPLAPAEAQLMIALLEANQQLVRHRPRVSSVDYRDFELQGDNQEFCRRRHAPFWGVPPALRPTAFGGAV